MQSPSGSLICSVSIGHMSGPSTLLMSSLCPTAVLNMLCSHLVRPTNGHITCVDRQEIQRPGLVLLTSQKSPAAGARHTTQAS